MSRERGKKTERGFRHEKARSGEAPQRRKSFPQGVGMADSEDVIRDMKHVELDSPVSQIVPFRTDVSPPERLRRRTEVLGGGAKIDVISREPNPGLVFQHLHLLTDGEYVSIPPTRYEIGSFTVWLADVPPNSVLELRDVERVGHRVLETTYLYVDGSGETFQTPHMSYAEKLASLPPKRRDDYFYDHVLKYRLAKPYSPVVYLSKEDPARPGRLTKVVTPEAAVRDEVWFLRKEPVPPRGLAYTIPR